MMCRQSTVSSGMLLAPLQSRRKAGSGRVASDAAPQFWWFTYCFGNMFDVSFNVDKDSVEAERSSLANIGFCAEGRRHEAKSSMQ